jgi:NAD+ kinase
MAEAVQRFFVVDQTEGKHYIRSFSSHVEVVDDPRAGQAIAVFGGDGAMLHAISQYHRLGLPFIGIHAGTRGFLMNNTADPDAFYGRLGELRYEELWMLEADVETPTGKQSVAAFNDIWVERSTGQTLRMRISIDGVQQPPIIVGDGIIFSTPQGSTGYNAAARGKVILPGVPVIQVTPISCVVDKTPIGSIILSSSSEVVVDFEHVEKRPGNLYYDGLEIASRPVRRLTVRRSEQTVRLGFAPELSFYHRFISWQFPE